METKHNAYVVLELPELFAGRITAFRKRYDPDGARLPAHITLLGSSGVGPIQPGTTVRKIENELKKKLASIEPIRFQFQEICCFPETCIYWLRPNREEVFARYHRVLSTMDVNCLDSPHPYRPHCTLSTREKLEVEIKAKIEREDFPREEILLETLSVLEISAKPFVARRLISRRLK